VVGIWLIARKENEGVEKGGGGRFLACFRRGPRLDVAQPERRVAPKRGHHFHLLPRRCITGEEEQPGAATLQARPHEEEESLIG